LIALKEFHYEVSSGKKLIPVQIKVDPTITASTPITNPIQDVKNFSSQYQSLLMSNKTEELTQTTVTASTSSLSKMVPTTTVTTRVVSNKLTGSQNLAHSSVSSDVAIMQAPLMTPQEQNCRWGRKQVNALIDKVSEHFEEFYDHSVKKKEIWQIIAASMRHDGYKCTSSDCDKKWRNLKATYLKVLRKQIIGGTDYRFEHFSRLHNILGKEIDPLGMREQALSDSTEQTVNPNESSQYLPNHEDLVTEEECGEWSNHIVERLLDLIQEESLLLKTVNANTAWEKIAQQMNEEGFILTVANCRSKWSGLKKAFNYYQQEASLSGSVPLWPFFARVRHVISSINIHADENISDVSNYKLGNSQVKRTGTMLERLDQIETEMSVNERLSKIEAQVEATQKIREARTQTNNLLQQVLLELRSITDSLEAENLQRHNFGHRIDPSSQMSANHGRILRQQQQNDNQPGIIIVEASQNELL